MAPLGEAKSLVLASDAGGNVRSLGFSAHQRGRPVGLADLTVRGRNPLEGASSGSGILLVAQDRRRRAARPTAHQRGEA